MASSALTCPQCRKALRSTKIIPSNRSIRCPLCGTHFVTSKSTPDVSRPPIPPNNSFVRTLVLAMAGSLLLLGTGVAVAFFVFQPRSAEAPSPEPTPEPVVQTPKGPSEEEAKLEEQQRQLEKQREQLELEKKQLQLERVLASGQEALEKREFDKAEAEFSEALSLFPTNEEALQGLVSARSEKVIHEKVTQKEKERKADFDKLLAQGKEASENEQFAEAVQAFEGALALFPTDDEAQKGLQASRDALAKTEAEAKSKKVYLTHMEAGRLAMLAQRYADAIREYTAALTEKPGDAQAKKGQEQAERQLEAIGDLEKRKNARKDMLAQARKAADNSRYNEAIAAYKRILRLFPTDVDAKKSLADVERKHNQAKAEHAQVMTAANLALRAQRFEEANRLFNQASQIMPEDPNAIDGAKQAGQQFRDAQAAQTAYFRFMQSGSLALQAGRNGDAAVAFREALRILPTDRDALAGLQQAQAGLEQDLLRKREFDQHVQAGRVAMQQRNWGEAVRHYELAQRLFPNEPQSLQALAQAHYALGMSEGQLAMSTGRFADAVRHFQSALRAKPNDPTARNSLQIASLRVR